MIRLLIFIICSILFVGCKKLKFHSTNVNGEIQTFYTVKNKKFGLETIIDTLQNSRKERVYDNDRLISSNVFINDTLIATTIFLNDGYINKFFDKKSGALKKEYFKDDSVATNKKFFKQIESVSYRCGRVECGCYETYYINGNLKSQYCYPSYQEEDTLLLKFINLSEISGTGYFKPLDGLYYYWYENGNYKKIESWKNYLKDGNWLFYDYEGSLIKKEVYKEDVLIEIVEY